jgi:hypothetical protein
LILFRIQCKSRLQRLEIHSFNSNPPEDMPVFRILTEDKNVKRIKATLIGLGLDFTLYRARGSWQGQEENSLAIELDNIPRHRAEDAARIIKSMNNQEAVLLQEIPVVSQLL